MQHIAKTTIGETTIYLTETFPDEYSVYEWRKGRPEKADQCMTLDHALSLFNQIVGSRVRNHLAALV